MKRQVITIGHLLEASLIKKSTKVLVNIADLKKNGFLKAKTAKLALVTINELSKSRLIKK